MNWPASMLIIGIGMILAGMFRVTVHDRTDFRSAVYGWMGLLFIAGGAALL